MLPTERSRSAGAHGAVFDFLCPLWFGRLTNQAQCNEAEAKEKKGSYPSARLLSVAEAQGADFDKTML